MKDEKQKHTPLPWGIDAYGDGIYIGPEGGPPITHLDFDGFDDLSETPDKNETWANAELIARACNSHYELLDILKEIVSAQCAPFKLNEDYMRIYIGRARKAIAKAEGHE